MEMLKNTLRKQVKCLKIRIQILMCLCVEPIYIYLSQNVYLNTWVWLLSTDLEIIGASHPSGAHCRGLFYIKTFRKLKVSSRNEVDLKILQQLEVIIYYSNSYSCCVNQCADQISNPPTPPPFYPLVNPVNTIKFPLTDLYQTGYIGIL